MNISEQVTVENELKIIGVGFGRTGTLSLKLALEELGFGPCYHMTELMKHPEYVLLWEAYAQGDPVSLKEIFQGYGATVDWPGCKFYEELMRLYPDAKIVLTVRDPESWYESSKNTIYQGIKQIKSSILVSALFFITGLFNSFQRHIFRLQNAIIWNGTFRGRFEDKDYAISIFNQHSENVKRNVPADKLLVYEVKEGWGPLCAFLAVPVPENKPFPHVNDRAFFKKMLKEQMLKRPTSIKQRRHTERRAS